MCCDLKNPKSAMKLCLRISFGLSLLLIGVAHYMDFVMFKMMVADGLGPLTVLGAIWAYILPALMIVGGGLFVVNQRVDIAALASGIALGSIPAGMLLKPVLGGVPLADVVPAAINAFIWMLVYVLVVRSSSCCGGGSCGTEGGKSC